MWDHRANFLLIGTVACFLVTACGSSGAASSTGTPTPSPSISSPDKVVVAVVNDLATGNYADICRHILRSPSQPCHTGSANSWKVSGFKVGNSSVQGDRALVVVTADRVCVLGTCAANHNPNLGLPHGSTTFDQAWLRSTSGLAFFTGAVQRVRGVWYAVAVLKRG